MKLYDLQEIGYDKLDELIYDRNTKQYFCNEIFKAGYVIGQEGELFFIVNDSLDSWYDGSGMTYEDIEDITIYKAEKTEHGYTLSDEKIIDLTY